MNTPHNAILPFYSINNIQEKAQSALNPIQSHINQLSHFKHNRDRPSRLRFRSKETNIKSLFKNAKQSNGQTYLSNPKRASLGSHTYNSQQKHMQEQMKRSAKLKRLKIAPSFEICINNEQDLSDIINDFKDPLVHLIKAQLQQIKEGRGKESESFDSLGNTL